MARENQIHQPQQKANEGGSDCFTHQGRDEAYNQLKTARTISDDNHDLTPSRHRYNP